MIDNVGAAPEKKQTSECNCINKKKVVIMSSIVKIRASVRLIRGLADVDQSTTYVI